MLTVCAAVGVIAVMPALGTPTIAADAPYHVAQVFHMGGKGNWDYLTVDSKHKRLYVPRTTHTMVLDAETGKLIADIPGQKGNHGVALVADAGRGFITDGKDGSVVIFDLTTNEVLGKVKTADDADAILYDPSSRNVLVNCGDAGAGRADFAKRRSEVGQRRETDRRRRQTGSSGFRPSWKGLRHNRRQEPGRRDRYGRNESYRKMAHRARRHAGRLGDRS